MEWILDTKQRDMEVYQLEDNEIGSVYLRIGENEAVYQISYSGSYKEGIIDFQTVHYPIVDSCKKVVEEKLHNMIIENYEKEKHNLKAIEEFMDSNYNEEKIKTYNGWYHIKDIQPKCEEEVLVILERKKGVGCSYSPGIQKSIYRYGSNGGYFLAENEAHEVRYWRRKEKYPYPDDIAKKMISELRESNISPQGIIDYQEECGIDTSKYTE